MGQSLVIRPFMSRAAFLGKGRSRTLLGAACCGCLAALLVSAATALGGGCGCGGVADEFVAAESGLVREWIVQVPFDSSRSRLQRVTVGDGLIVTQSGDGGVQAIQTDATAGAPRPGSVLWSRSASAGGGPVSPVSIGSSLVTVAGGLGLDALDRRTGQVLWHAETGRPSAMAAVPVGEEVYVPAGSSGLQRLPVDPLRLNGNGHRESGTDSDAADRPVIDAGGDLAFPAQALGDGVMWMTESGRLVFLQKRTNGWAREEFECGAAPVSPPVIRGRSVFVVLRGTHDNTPRVARIDLLAQGRRRLQAGWWDPLPDQPDGGPLLAGDTLVVSLGPSGMIGFSAETGEQLWRSCVVGTLVSAGGDRAWVFDDMGRLTGIDLATGEPIDWLPLGCLTLPVVNTASDRLVLASPTGLVVSLAPRAAPPSATEGSTTAAEAVTTPAEPAGERDDEDPGTMPR